MLGGPRAPGTGRAALALGSALLTRSENDIAFTTEEFERIAAAQELRIAVANPDATLRRALPIWVVCVDDRVYVRTWHRRDTGWFGRVLTSRRARVFVPGLEVDVDVTDVGEGPPDLRAAVDAAYRAKYGGASAERMAGDEAASATLRLDPRNP